jgi:hypothetical protein
MVDIRHLVHLSEPIPWTSSLLGSDSEDEDESEVSSTSDDSENESNQTIEEPMIKTLFISRVLAPNHYPIQR